MLLLELDEARKHLTELIDNVRANEFDTPDDIRFHIEHLIDHLCHAWNTRELTPEQHAAMSQEEFQGYCSTVPDAFGQRKLEGR